MNVPRIPTELIAPAFNPASFRNRDAVHDLFTRLRREYPLGIAEVPGYDPHWIVSKYADLREITRLDELFHGGDRSKTLISQAGEALVKEYTGGQSNIFRSLVQLDPPEHGWYRDVTKDVFMPKSIESLEPQIRATAKRHVERFLALGPEADFAKDLAFLYPLEVVLDLIGVPKEDHAKMLRLTQWLFTYADPDLKRPGSDLGDPQEITRTWREVFEEFKEYYDPVIADRRSCPRGDIASLIANGKVNGCPMEDRAMISYFVIASTAGHDTTAATTGSTAWVLAEQPALLKRLQDDPALMPRFVEESIRWASPVQEFVRSAVEDYDLRGHRIKKGDLIYLSYISANRDEEVFEDPFTFKPDRWPNRHVGFGYGGHICLGQHLARFEMRLLWEELIPHLKTFGIAGPGRWAESEFVCGPKSIPVRFTVK
ncbi:MAG: cytochrome P450 [Gammaproteobacteria bacterium]|nr:cytochrome P450 [Gammaproteobacteria bacterium]MBI5619146.1 cytochrome P450 [Gammaproteobacteria bacterium]